MYINLFELQLGKGSENMDVKVNQISQTIPTEQAKPVQQANGDFKFLLTSNIAEADLQAKIQVLIENITQQGEKLYKRRDIKDMKRYRSLIKEFLNEIVNRSHSFSRENFLDRKGRHRVYGIIKLIDDNLDQLAKELVNDQVDNLDILSKIGEIRGLLLDILT